MRTILAAAVAVSLAVPAVADDGVFDIATMRSFETVMFVAKLRPRHRMKAFRVFECAVAESKKLAEQAEPFKVSTDAEAAKALAACKPQVDELANVAEPSEVTAVTTAVQRASSTIIFIARSPRSTECVNPANAYCLLIYLP